MTDGLTFWTFRGKKNSQKEANKQKDLRSGCGKAKRVKEGKRRKEGAGEKALQAPRNENVQSNRGKYRTGRKYCKLGATDASKRRGGKTKVSQASLEIRNEKGPDDLPSA